MTPFSTDWNSGPILHGTIQPVTITFNPTTLGAVARNVIITANSANSPISVAASGTGVQQTLPTRIIELSGDLSFGNVTLGQTGTRTLTITNNGTGTLTVSSISGQPGFTSNFTGPILPGQSLPATIVFSPTIVQSYNTPIQVMSDATSGTPTIQATGNGVQQVTPTRIISLSGDLSFGDVIVGQNPTRSFIINNTGNSPLTVSSIITTSGYIGSFSGVIQPNTPTQVSVTFSPSNVQPYPGSVTVVSNATSGNGVIPVSGNGVQQVTPTRIISLSGDLSFGDVTVGETLNHTLTILNSGNSTLTVFSIVSPSGYLGNYSGPVPAGGSVPVTVSFTPTNVQSYPGTLQVNSDRTSGIDTKAISGNGISNQPTVNPPVGTYSTCASIGPINCPTGESYAKGFITCKVVNINTSTHQIILEVKKCDGSFFFPAGNCNVVSQLCAGGNTYGFTSFSENVNTFQITITDNNMTGFKAYVPFIIQGSSLFSAPTITIDY